MKYQEVAHVVEECIVKLLQDYLAGFRFKEWNKGGRGGEYHEVYPKEKAFCDVLEERISTCLPSRWRVSRECPQEYVRGRSGCGVLGRICNLFRTRTDGRVDLWVYTMSDHSLAVIPIEVKLAFHDREKDQKKFRTYCDDIEKLGETARCVWRRNPHQPVIGFMAVVASLDSEEKGHAQYAYDPEQHDEKIQRVKKSVPPDRDFGVVLIFASVPLKRVNLRRWTKADVAEAKTRSRVACRRF